MKNKLCLKGTIKSEVKKITDNQYEFQLGIKRYSGYEDVIIVRMYPSLVNTRDFTIGNTIAVYGSVRNKIAMDEKNNRHTVLCAWAEGLSDGSEIEGEYLNEIELEGAIQKKPFKRTTPLNRTITEFIVANRDDKGSNSIICIAWDSAAELIAKCGKYTLVSVKARFQSRDYQKKIGENEYEIKTTYELSTCGFELL